MNQEVLKQCWFLAGPTAVGKTALSVALAKAIGAEVISMDSMAIYQGMDIGTAKPLPPERGGVAHHMLDVLHPHQEFSVSEFVFSAGRIAEDICQRRSIPLFVGGTGLYLRSLLRGIFTGPEADWELRRQLEKDAGQNGKQWLHDELRRVDPETAIKLHPNDVRRIIRAIEVYRLTGVPLSQQQTQQPLNPDERPDHVYWLDPPREWLHERINLRVDQMMEQGLLQETRTLLLADPPPGRTARQALGYRELIDHLENGTKLDAAVEQIRTGTRQFAKRQHTWFRNLEECAPVALDGTESTDALVERLTTGR